MQIFPSGWITFFLADKEQVEKEIQAPAESPIKIIFSNLTPRYFSE